MEPEPESVTIARIKTKAKASYVFQKYGKQESVMLAILEHLLETIEKLENGEK